MMSLALYSNVWPRVIVVNTCVVHELTRKFGVESLALTETCPDTKFHLYWYAVIELRFFEKKKKEEKKKNMDKMGNYFFPISCSFTEIFGTQLI